MANALDVGQYILEKHGSMTAMKLQKIVYYSQAWNIVWDDVELFAEEIEAWKNGPVVRELWEKHRGKYRVEAITNGFSANLSKDEGATVDIVLEFYGKRSAQELSDLTHLEEPWRKAWAQGENTIITKEALAEYYSSIEPPSEQEA